MVAAQERVVQLSAAVLERVGGEDLLQHLSRGVP